eukprot:TRINITY_DN10753_c0_g1_i1.p1 TRINITY_DN10753_c0_g1~~TRINITY_DN10753_c0_g1_i1.p1  ORF type:complete len:438 (+),score=116.27 TRINITY_DN10753_c0_g1_i1:75-1388(+)
MQKVARRVMKERYIASMVLGGVGDALGYYGGHWEFCFDGRQILRELGELTKEKGLSGLKITGDYWCVSDDTVMNMATAEGLIAVKDVGDELFQKIGSRYVACWSDMNGRAPGGTCGAGVRAMEPNGKGWNTIEFRKQAGGCGAAMRSMCIGLRFWKESQLEDLIACGVESGRMSHHHPTGYLGAVVGALFTSYSIRDVSPPLWGVKLMDEVLPKVKEYIQKSGRQVDENLKDFEYFENHWNNFLVARQIRTLSNKGEVMVGPKWNDSWANNYEDRYNFWKEFAYTGWPGASGHDAPLVAYDALLWGWKNNKSPNLWKDVGEWERTMVVGALHGGDSDSTGTMAAAWYGAMYGFEGVPECNYDELEYVDRLRKLGEDLYAMSMTEEDVKGLEAAGKEEKIQFQVDLPTVVEEKESDKKDGEEEGDEKPAKRQKREEDS